MKSFFLLLILLVSLNGFSQKDTVIPYGSNQLTGKYLQVNGVKLYYEIYGKGAPLLLIHGNGTGIKGWSAQIDYFSKKYQVIVVDCRGRGKSELGKDSLTYIQQASDLSVLITELKLKQVTVVGKSDGGIIGLLMAIHYPNELKRLVAYGSNMTPDTMALFPDLVSDIHRLRTEADQMLAKGDTTKNWLVEQQRYRMMEFQPHITADELGKITIPVLVMSCDRDLIKEDHTLWIYRSIPQASLSISPGEVHRFPTLNPTLFNAIVDNWLLQPFKGDDVRFK